MNGKKANQRKLENLVVFGDIQFKLAIINLLYLLLITIVIVVITLTPLYQEMSNSSGSWDAYLSAKTFIFLTDHMGLVLAVITVLSFLHSVVLSHKLCGPLVQIRGTIERISLGDFTRKIHLRKGDYLKREARQINAMMDQVSQSFGQVTRDHDAILRMIAEELAAAPPDSDTAMALRRIKPLAERCQRRLDAFSFDPKPDGSSSRRQPETC